MLALLLLFLLLSSLAAAGQADSGFRTANGAIPSASARVGKNRTSSTSIRTSNSTPSTAGSSSTETPVCKPACGRDVLSEKIQYNPIEKILVPSSNKCNFHAFSYSDSLKCLRGSWIIFLGGSVTFINARRAVSFFQSGGKETGYVDQKNISAEFRKNFDVVYKSKEPMMTEFSAHAIHVKATMTPERAALANVKFLEDANKANMQSLTTDDLVILRLSMIYDNYMFSTEKIASKLKELRTGLASKGIKRVFMVVGPIGKWFELCEPNQIAKFGSWACQVPFLKGKTPQDIQQVYGFKANDVIEALVLAKKSRTLTSSVILSYTGEFSRKVQSSLDMAANKLNSTSLLPVHQSDYFWHWLGAPLVASLQAVPVEAFQGHPTGISAHWYWMLTMTALCPLRADCPRRPVFTSKCSQEYMKNVKPESLRNSRGTKTSNNLPNYFQGLEIKGCSISMGNYAPPAGPRYEWNPSTTQHDERSAESSGLSLAASLSILIAAILILVFWIVHARVELNSGSDKSSNNRDEGIRIDSLVFSRYIASVLVVSGHMQQKGVALLPLPKHVLSWGFTWVPFFFMLSGFVLTYVKIIKVVPTTPIKLESPLGFVWKRAVSTFPLYFAGLVSSALFSFVTGHGTRADAAMVVQESLLLQAWFPSTIESTLQAHCWFISCEVLYWALFPRIVHFLNAASSSLLAAIVLLCAFLGPWTVTVIAPWLMGEPSDWYTGHVPSHVSSRRDLVVVLLKFHPLSYLHLFVLGCACAFVFRMYKLHRDDTKRQVESNKQFVSAVVESYSHSRARLFGVPWSTRLFVVIVENGATVGYVSLACIFYFSFLKPFGAKLSLRLGLLAPFHALILLGLASDRDILSPLFSHWLLQAVGNWSYAQFIFQFISFHLCTSYFSSSSGSFPAIFWLITTAVAACAYNLLQLPVRDEKRFRWFLAFSALLALMWSLAAAGFFALPSLSRSFSSVPSYVSMQHGCFDARLNISVSGVGFVINPALIKQQGSDDSFIFAARRHQLQTETTSDVGSNGNVTTTKRIIYHSAIVLGWLKLQEGKLVQKRGAALSLSPSSSFGKSWFPCLAPPAYFSENNTFVQVVTTGPQDPRLMWWGKQLILSFFSMRPVSRQGELCPSKSNASLLVQRENTGSVFIVPINFSKSGKPELTNVRELPLPPSRRGRPESTVEKNLLLFEKGSSLCYVYRVFPHVVYTIANASGWTEPTRYVGDSRLLSDLLIRPDVADDGLIAHGGAAPIQLSLPLLRGTNVTNLYLGSFHTTSAHDRRWYSHHLYIFEGSRFDIVAYSSQLPLVEQSPGNRGTFISSILETKTGDFLISYGSGDVESRILVVTNDMFRELFAHSHLLKQSLRAGV